MGRSGKASWRRCQEQRPRRQEGVSHLDVWVLFSAQGTAVLSLWGIESRMCHHLTLGFRRSIAGTRWRQTVRCQESRTRPTSRGRGASWTGTGESWWRLYIGWQWWRWDVNRFRCMLMEDVGHERQRGIKLQWVWPEPLGWESCRLATYGRLLEGGVCGQKVGITSVLLRYPYNDAFWIFEWRCYIHHWLSESGEGLGLEVLDSSTHSLTTCSLPFGQRFCLITFLSLNAYLAWNKAFCW